MRTLQRTVFSIPCCSGEEYKGECSRVLKVRLNEHRKAVIKGATMQSGVVDHVWKEKFSHVKNVSILDRKEHWRVR